MEDNLLQNIFPLQFVSRIVALSPFSTESKRLSVFWTVYSLLLAISMICLSVYQLNLEISDKTNSKLFKFVAFVYIASPTISRTLTCIVFIIKYKVFLHFLDCVSEIESVIKKVLNVPFPKCLYLKFQHMIIFVIVVIEGVQVLLVFLTSGVIPAVIRGFTIISYLCQAQFVCCVLLLHHYLIVITDQLRKLDKTTNFTKKLHFQSSRILWSEDTTVKESNEEGVVNTCRELIRYISIIKDDLNSFFSFPILLIIADSLVLITFNLYMLIKNMSFAMDSQEMMQQISYLYTVCVNTVQVIYIAFPCSAPGEQIQFAAALTHKLINNKEQYHETTNLVLLSKQLLHVEMVFTACGFFTLNESLITSVFAAISTQLVILLQFQMSSSEPTESTTNP